MRTSVARVVASALLVAATKSAARPEVALVERAAVPAGFEPVRLDSPEAGPLAVRVWGRTYVFPDGPLPSQIVALEQDLFSAPPKLHLRAGGHDWPVTWTARELGPRSQRSATFASRGAAGPLQIEASTTVEFDGMVRVALRLRSEVATAIERFGYEFRFPESIAQYFNHHLEYDYNRMRVRNTDLLKTAGRVPSTPLRIPFVPTFALGNRDVGFEWWSDSDARWSPRRRDSIELASQGGRVSLSITPIAAAVKVGPERTWEHEFAVFALPMRAKPAVVHATRFLAPDEARNYASSKWLRTYTIWFPGDFQPQWFGLPAARQDSAQRAIRSKLDELGVGYIPYAALTAVPFLHPFAMKKASEWAATGVMFTGPSEGDGKFLLSRGWRRNTPYSYAVCAARTEYLDWILQEVLRTVDDESPAGLYFDWGATMEQCSRGKGELEASWGYFALRDFYRRLYESLEARDPKLLLTIHTHGQPRALAAFVDYVFIGEALNVAFRQNRPFEAIRDDPSLYAPHYMALPVGFLEAQFFPRAGGVVSLLPEVHFARDPKDRQREARLTREMFAVTLLNEMPVWQTNCDYATRVQIMRAVDRLGNLDEARMFGWWDDPLHVGSAGAVRGSAFAAAKKALLVVTNWSDRAANVVVKPDLRALGVPAGAAFEDAEEKDGDVRPIPSEGIELTIPARDLRLVLIRPR